MRRMIGRASAISAVAASTPLSSGGLLASATSLGDARAVALPLLTLGVADPFSDAIPAWAIVDLPAAALLDGRRFCAASLAISVGASGLSPVGSPGIDTPGFPMRSLLAFDAAVPVGADPFVLSSFGSLRLDPSVLPTRSPLLLGSCVVPAPGIHLSPFPFATFTARIRACLDMPVSLAARPVGIGSRTVRALREVTSRHAVRNRAAPGSPTSAQLPGALPTMLVRAVVVTVPEVHRGMADHEVRTEVLIPSQT